MNEQEQIYIKTYKSWVESTQLNQAGLTLKIDHNKALIENLKYQLIADQNQFDLNMSYLDAGDKQFQEWLKTNKQSPNIGYKISDILSKEEVNECNKSAFENYVDHLMIMHKAGQMIGPIADVDENIIDLIKVFNMATSQKIKTDEDQIRYHNCHNDNPMHKHKEEPIIHQSRILYVKEKSLPDFFKASIEAYAEGRGLTHRDKIHRSYDVLRAESIFMSKQDLIDQNGAYYDQVVFELTDRADACAIPLQINKVYNVEVYDDLSFSLKLSDVKVILSRDKIQDCCK